MSAFDTSSSSDDSFPPVQGPSPAEDKYSVPVQSFSPSRTDSSSSSSESVAPAPAEQARQIKALMNAADLTHITEAYAIDEWWHREWRKSTGYDGTAPTNEPVKAIDNHYLADTTGAIRVDGNETYIVIVPESVWNKLYEWYGGGPALKCKVQWSNTSQKLVPVAYQKYRLIYGAQEKVMEVPKCNTVKEMKEIAMKVFGVPSDRETRLIDWYQDKFYAALDDECDVASARLQPGQALKLDEKDEKGEWKEQEETVDPYRSTAVGYSSGYNTHSTYGYSTGYGYNTGYGYSSGYGYGSSYRSNYGAWVGPGKVGFTNLGNTCFFNSGVQCLMHTMTLVNVFLNSNWEVDLNETNPIGSHGKVVKAFAELVKDVWEGDHGIVQPYNLKTEMGIFRDQFAGWGQQDSHELIMAMVDAIHEDLNRCRVKPQVEPVYGNGENDLEIAEKAWHNHKLRNDSVIVDRFYGLLRSVLSCPECKKTTVVFDPYSSLPLPLQKKQVQKVKALFIPLDPKAPKARLVLLLPAQPKQEDVSQAVSQLLGRDVKVVLGMCNTYSWKLQWNEATCDSYSSYSTPEFYVFEIDDTSKFWVPCIVAIKIWNDWKTYADEKPVFGPFILPFEDDNVTENDIAEKAASYLSWMWKPVDESVSQAKPAEGKMTEKQQDSDENGSFSSENETKPDIDNEEVIYNAGSAQYQRLGSGDEADSSLEVLGSPQVDSEGTPNVELQPVMVASRSGSTPDVGSTPTASSDWQDNEEFKLGDDEQELNDDLNVKLDNITPSPYAAHVEAKKDSSEISSLSSSSSDSWYTQSKSYTQSYSYNKAHTSHVSGFDDDDTGLTDEGIKWKDRLVVPETSYGQGCKFGAEIARTYNEYTATLARSKKLTFMGDRFVKLNFSRDSVTKESGFDVNGLIMRALDEPETFSQVAKEGKGDVTLDQCFQYFATSEVLDENNQWFCPNCRTHVCATKKLDVWSVPDVMIIQLKRFITGSYTTKKLEMNVDYPDELDMSPYVVGPHDQCMRYKFYAVSEHMGALGGGHYIAHAAVQDASGNEEWYQFNDSSASKSSQAEAHTPLAYVLFYVREGSKDSIMSQWEKPPGQSEKDDKQEDDSSSSDDSSTSEDDPNATKKDNPNATKGDDPSPTKEDDPNATEEEVDII